MPSKSIYAHDQKVIDFLADRIKTLRKEKGITQEELANEAEIGIAQLKRIENANVNTSISTIFRISKALNIPLNEMFNKFIQ